MRRIKAPKISERSKKDNRARLLEEASTGIFELLHHEGRSRTWLAKRLGRSKSFVSKILEGSHNFTLGTLSDVYLAFDRAVHLTLGADADEYRLPDDEVETYHRTLSFDGFANAPKADYGSGASSTPDGNSIVKTIGNEFGRSA